MLGIYVKSCKHISILFLGELKSQLEVEMECVDDNGNKSSMKQYVNDIKECKCNVCIAE